MKRRVLVLEDKPGTLRALSEILRIEGYDVRTYASAEEATPALADPDADVAVLDIRLPGRQGDDFGRELRRRHPHLKILFLTAEQRLDALRADLPDCPIIHKPFLLPELLALIGPADLAPMPVSG